MSKLQLQSSTIIKNKHSSLYAKTTDKQQMALQRYGVDDNLLCLQHMETLYTNTTESTNVKKKPNASHWGLDFHTLQSKFDTLQESFEAIQQDPELTSISYCLKKLEDRTHDDLNDNQLTSWLHNLETLIDNERKAHADEISQIHRKLNNFLLNQQNVKSEPPTSEPQAKQRTRTPSPSPSPPLKSSQCIHSMAYCNYTETNSTTSSANTCGTSNMIQNGMLAPKEEL